MCSLYPSATTITSAVLEQFSSVQGVPTLLNSLFRAKLIPAPVASFKFPRWANDSSRGELTLGGLNPTAYIPSTLITVKNMNKSGFYEVKLDGFSVGDCDMGATNRSMVVDTGTVSRRPTSCPHQLRPIAFKTGFARRSPWCALHVKKRAMQSNLAPKDYEAIHRAIPGATFVAGEWRVPCQLTTGITLTIAGKNFSLEPRDLAFFPIDESDLDGACLSGIGVGGISPIYADNVWLACLDSFVQKLSHLHTLGRSCSLEESLPQH